MSNWQQTRTGYQLSCTLFFLMSFCSWLIKKKNLISFAIIPQNRATPKEIVQWFLWKNQTSLLVKTLCHDAFNRDPIICTCLQNFMLFTPWLSNVASKLYQNVKISPKYYVMTACHHIFMESNKFSFPRHPFYTSPFQE